MANPRGPVSTSEDVYAASRDGDELYLKQWSMNSENDINTTDQHGFTPLHYACSHGHVSLVEYILSKGAKIDIANMGGDSPLHVATANGKYDIVLKLLRYQPNINLSNEHGNTPLHYAAFWNYIGISEVLVKHGAVIAISNKFGDSPYTRARPTLMRKFQVLAGDYGQSIETIPYKKPLASGMRKEFLEFRQRQMEVDIKQVTISLKIGQDKYGELWMGSWSGHTVQVKKFPIKDNLTQVIQDTFPRQYPKLRILSHDNISPLLAVVPEPQIHLITMHFPIGTLYHVLHDINSEIRLNLEEGVKMAKDVCNGIKYIHSNELLVNRYELNPHHVVVDADLTAKLDLSQFRFSFMDTQHIYYPQWCAPECLQKRPDEIDKRAANMYTFALILWEIGTANIPFGEMSPLCAGLKIARENARPMIPTFINTHLKRIIDICWNADPIKRPKFDRIQPIMERLNVSE